MKILPREGDAQPLHSRHERVKRGNFHHRRVREQSLSRRAPRQTRPANRWITNARAASC